MRDDWSRIKVARSQEAGHLMPCLIHPPADDAIYRDSLEDHFCREVDLHRLGGNAEHLYVSADTHERECLMNRRWHTRHLEHDVDAEPVGVPLHHVRCFVWMDDVVRGHS